MRAKGSAGFAARPAVATMLVLVLLAVLAILATVVARQAVTGRRVLERRQHQVQCEWLVRSGIELASARLLADPSGYKGEAVELIPESTVEVRVERDKDSTNVFRLRCEARCTEEGRVVVARSATRLVRRSSNGEQARIEVTIDRAREPP